MPEQENLSIRVSEREAKTEKVWACFPRFGSDWSNMTS